MIDEGSRVSATKLPLPFLSGLTPSQLSLLDAVVRAHQKEARRGLDLSTQVFHGVMLGSGSPINAAAAAMLSAGGQHGPVGPARFIYETADRGKIEALMRGAMGPNFRRVPGFGHSTVKDQVDPIWLATVDKFSCQSIVRIVELQNWVNELRPNKAPLYPNATMFMAAMCVEIGVPKGLELIIPTLARLPVWVENVR